MPDLVMPRLSDSMEEGVVLSWLKSEGDEVELGEELVEIETDKANMTYESDLAGTLTRIVAAEGDTVPVGGPIAVIGGSEAEESEADRPGSADESEPDASSASRPGASGEQADGSKPGTPGSEAEDVPVDETSTPAKTQSVSDSSGPEPEAARSKDESADGGRVKASPLARRIAREQGVELSGLSGSGPGGRIVKADVEKAESGAAAEPEKPAGTERQADGAQTAKGETEVVELTRLQQTVARRMSESKATAPHFYLTTEVDMSACVEGRSALKASAGEGDVVPSFNDMVVKASALALREFPKANGSYKDGQIELHARVNVGIAVAAPDVLVVPTIFDADLKGLRQIATEARELAGKVRDQKITPPELSGGTFSVSNLGMYGVTEFDAVVNTPQAAILAVGAIVERPVAKGGEVIAAPIMKMTLSCDHRILYGAEGAEFLARVRSLLEQPLGLAL